MRIRLSVAGGYILLLVCCAVLFVLLGFHELVQEPLEYSAGGPAAHAPRWVAYAELAIYSAVPIVLLSSWFLIRRTLRPLTEIAAQIDAWDPELGLKPMAVAPESAEAAAVTGALNRASGRLQRAFQEIREFSLRASHEMKTPLTILRGQAESEARRAESRGDAAAATRMAAQIDEIDRMARMVDSLTLLAKADGGLLPLKVEPGRLDGLVMEFYDDILALAEPTGILVHAKIGKPVYALFDRQRMRQVFLALAENAVKYNIPRGTIELGAAESGGRATLWIENTGLPLSTAALQNVFEPFFRGPEIPREIEGSGLGLSIARSIIDAHGGRITFDPLPPNRIRVSIQLALALDPPEEAPPSVPKPPPQHHPMDVEI